MAASEYGLSIVLDFEDNASAGMKSAESTFSSLSGSADKLTMGVGSTADSLLDLNTSVVGMSVMGSQLQNMGQGLLGVLGSVGGQVIETGSNFESFKLTLDALYGSSEAASGVINDLFKYAVKSPYNVTDLQDMVVTLKSQGLEAFDEMTNASTGFAQSTMDWIGDLQAFRPGVAASRWKLALQNFLSGTDTQSSRVLRNILDVGDLATYVGHDLGTTVTERFQTLMDLVTKMNMAGMQGTLQKTWSVTLANMGDAWEQFAYRLGFGNKSTGLYQSAVQTAQNILSAMTDVFTNDSVIDATSNALKSLVSPLESITSVIAGLAPAFSNWLGQNPQLVSFAAGLTTVSGVALVAGGSLLKLSSGVMNWMLNVQRLGGLTGIFNMLGNSLTALSYRTAGIGSVGLMAYLAWKNNVLGIRDLLTSMGGEIKSVFTTVVQDVSTGNKTITESLNAQGFTPFTQGLSDLREVAGSAGESLYDGFTKVFELFGVNLPKLSSETFSVKEALNDFGESLTERFGDVDQFKEKYGGLISTIGTIGGAFISTLAASTVLSGGIKMLSSSFGALMTNFRVITNTLLSPMGLLGVGVAALTAGYYNNFLGLQDVVTPVVDNIRAKIDQLVTSFSQKDSSGKNSILSAITDKIVSLNETAKTWRSDKLIDNISWRRGVKTTTWLDEGVSIGTLLANGLMSGLMLFGNPIQKALGLGMLAVSHNVGNVQDGLYNIVDDLINTKDLLVEMSTGYGPKSRTLAEQFGLTDFAEGLVNIKDTFKNAGTSLLEGITESNNILGNWVKNTFPDLDFSLTGLLNGIGNLGTSISEKLNTDKGQTFMRNFGQFTSQLGVASAASAVLTGGMGLLFKTFGGLGGVALGLTNALVNPFTLGTVAIMAYQRDFGGIHTKISEFLGRQQDVIDLARSYQGHQYATRFNKDGTESLVNVEAVNAAVDVWERKGELLSSLWDNIKSGAKGAAEEITSVFSALFDTGNQGEATLIEKLGGKVLEFGGFDGIKQKLDSTGQSFGEIATKGALVAGAFAAVSAAGRALGVSLDPVSSGLKLVNQGFNLVKSGAGQAVMGVFDGLGSMVRSSSGSFSRTFGVVRDLFVESFSGRGGGFSAMGDVASDFMTSLRSSFTLLTKGKFSNFFNKGGIQKTIQGAFSNTDPNKIFSNWGKGFKNLGNSLFSGIKGAFGNVKNAFSNVSDFMSTTWGGNLGKIKSAWSNFGSAFGTSMNTIKSSWGNFTSSFKSLSAPLKKMGSSIKKITSSVPFTKWFFGDGDSLTEKLQTSTKLLSKFKDAYKGAFKDGFSGLRDSFSTIGSSLKSFVKDLGSSVGNVFKSLYTSVGTTIKGLFTSTVSTLKGIGTSALGGIKSLYNTFGGALAPVGAFLQKNAGNILGIVAQISTTIQTIRWQTMFGMMKSGLSMFGQAFLGASKMVIGLTGMATGFSLLTAAALTFGTLTTSEWDGLSQAMREQETLVGKVSAGYKWFTDQLSGATAKAVDFISSFDVEGFMGKVTKTVGSLGETIVSIVGGTTGTNGLADLGGRLIDSMFSGVVNNSSKIGSSIQKVFNSVTSAIQTYAPSIGQNLGTLIGKAFQFAGNNAGTFVDTAFTLMESFINGLVANKAQIVNGALQIVDAFVEGVRSHGGNIVNGAMELVSMFVDGLSSRSGAIGEAANTIIQPLMQGIVSNLSKLEGIAKEALGSLMNTIKGVIAEGIANIVNDIGNAALIIAAVMGGIAGVLAFVPGMQVMAAQLGASALQLGALGGGLKVGSNLLDNYSESTLGASSAVNKFNTETEQTKTFVPEADFSQFQSELNQYDLKKMWANDEIVYTVRTNDDGSTEEVSYKVKQLKDEQGNITYQLVMEESGKSGTEIVDENKSYAESNPAEQSVQASDDGSVKNAIDENKAYGDSTPVTQEVKLSYDSEGYNKSVEAQTIEENEQNARNNYASTRDRTIHAKESVEDYKQTFWTTGKEISEFQRALSDAQQEYQYGFSTSWAAEESRQIDALGTKIPKVMGQIYDAISNKPDDWIPTAEDLQAISVLDSLSKIDFSTMFGENGTATVSQMTSYLTNMEAVLSQLQGSEGVEFTVKFNEDGSIASIEEVKQDVENLDGTSANVDVNEEGAEEAANNVEELNGGMDELNGKNGTATVDESGAEETKSKVEGVNEALDNVDDSKNVEVTTDTDTMSIKELADALSKVNDSYDIKISVIVNGMPEVEKLKSVLDSGSTGGFGFMGVTNSNIAINVTADTTQIDNLKTKVTELGATEATVKVIAEVDSSKVTSLIDTINGVGTKIINVIAVVQGQAQLNTLRDTINSINSKTVTVTANVSGKSEVDALKESIDALQDKTVTVTTVTKEVKEKNAAGTYNFGGGWTYINEQGGELVNLPSGSQIIPHDLSLREQYSKGFETGQKRARADLEQFATLTAPTINMSQLNAPASPISQDSYDYSVNFNEGSIVVKVDNAKGDTDYAAAAEKIWYYIERKQKRDALARRNR